MHSGGVGTARLSRAGRVTVALVVALSLAGCLGIDGGPAVTDEAARERALAAEEQYLRDRLENASCAEGWGTNSYTGIQQEATVVNHTTDGVFVDVVHPFWYGTATVDADGRSEATYLVTDDEARRVRGTDVSPC